MWKIRPSLKFKEKSGFLVWSAGATLGSGFSSFSLHFNFSFNLNQILQNTITNGYTSNLLNLPPNMLFTGFCSNVFIFFSVYLLGCLKAEETDSLWIAKSMVSSLNHWTHMTLSRISICYHPTCLFSGFSAFFLFIFCITIYLVV